MKLAGPGSRAGAVRRYGTELMVVFVGVWLSLLAENWRQARVDAASERASVARMAEDLESDLEDLRFNLQRAQAGVEAGRLLLDGSLNASADRDSLARALSALQFCSMFIENPAEYLALRNSGRLDIISNEDLRRRIVSAYESRIFLNSLHANDCEWTETVSQVMTPYVRLGEPPEVREALEMSSDGFPDTSRPRVLDVLNAEGLLSHLEFRNALTALVSRRRFLMGEIEATIERAEHLRLELSELADAT